MSRPGSVTDVDADRHRARYLLEQLGLTGDEPPATLSGGEARRAALARVAGARARHPAARRADQPSGPARHRVAGARARRHALRHRADQPRPPAAGAAVARHGLARPRHHPHAGPGFRRASNPGATRCWSRRRRERHKLGRKIAMEEDWLRYGVTARRKRNQQRLAELHALRKRRTRAARRGGHGAAGGGARRTCPAGWSWSPMA